MKKPQEKRIVKMEWDESTFKTRGTYIWLRKTCWFVVLGILLIGFGFYAIYADVELLSWLFMGSAVAWSLILIVMGSKAGTKYWNEMKDKKEPIELGELGKFWWWKKKDIRSLK